MLDAAWLIPAFPLTGFLLLVLLGRKLGEPLAGWLATGAMAGSFVVASDDSRIIAHHSSKVTAESGSFVIAYDGASVVAKDGSMVRAKAGSHVAAYAGATVYVEPYSNVTAYGAVNVVYINA